MANCNLTRGNVVIWTISDLSQKSNGSYDLSIYLLAKLNGNMSIIFILVIHKQIRLLT